MDTSEDELVALSDRQRVKIAELLKQRNDLLAAAELLEALDSIGYSTAATKARESGYPQAMRLLKLAIAAAKRGN